MWTFSLTILKKILVWSYKFAQVICSWPFSSWVSKWSSLSFGSSFQLSFLLRTISPWFQRLCYLILCIVSEGTEKFILEDTMATEFPKIILSYNFLLHLKGSTLFLHSIFQGSLRTSFQVHSPKLGQSLQRGCNYYDWLLFHSHSS